MCSPDSEQLSSFRIAQLASLARHLDEIELTISESGTIVSANTLACTTYGYSESELIGMNVRQLRIPVESNLVESQLKHALKNDHIVFETMHIRKDGSNFPVAVNCHPFVFEGKNYLHSLVKDISEKKRTEAALRRKHKHISQTLDGVGIGLWDWYVKSRDLYINAAWANILGYTLEELQPITIDTWFDLVHPDDVEMVSQIREAEFTSSNSEYSCEVRMKHKNGHWVWVLERGHVVESLVDGRPLRMTGTQEDITLRMEQEIRMSTMLKAILAQNDLKERLFTILAHDLRGPIGNLNGLLGLASDGHLSVQELQDALPNLKHAAESAYSLLGNILQWVRSSMDEIKVLQERIVVDQLITKVHEWLEPAATSKSIELKLEPAPHLSIVSDLSICETILRNLVSNAIKFSPAGAQIKIIACNTAENPEIQLKIIDQGPGIAPDVLERIKQREPGKRSNGTAGESGSGLGLMFCQEMASKIGIRIEIESTIGKGSTFSMVFPDVLDGEL